MPSVNDLTDFETVQEYSGIPDEDRTHTERLIAGASGWANKKTSRLLKARDLTEYYDGNGSRILFLANYPITSITSIHQDSARVFGDDTLVDVDAYVSEDERGKLYGEDVFWYHGVQTIKVVYNGGYSDVPEDLELVILIAVDYLYKAFADHRFGVSSVSVGDKNINYEKDIPTQAKKLLESFMKMVIV